MVDSCINKTLECLKNVTLSGQGHLACYLLPCLDAFMEVHFGSVYVRLYGVWCQIMSGFKLNNIGTKT